jgi:hypothetical protein
VELPQLTVELDARPAQELALAPALLLSSALFARRPAPLSLPSERRPAPLSLLSARRLSLSPPPPRPHRQPPHLPPRRSPPMLLAQEPVGSPARALPSETAALAQGGADLLLRTAVPDVKRHSELARKQVVSLLKRGESQRALDKRGVLTSIYF